MVSDNHFISESATFKSLKDVLRGLLNRSFGKAGLAIGTTNTRIQIANNFDFCIDGKTYRKTAVDNISFTGTVVQAIGKYVKYLCSLVSDGTVTVTKGDAATTSALAAIPDLPDSSAPFGYFEVYAASVTYTMGDNLASGNLTVTYQDLSSIVEES